MLLWSWSRRCAALACRRYASSPLSSSTAMSAKRTIMSTRSGASSSSSRFLQRASSPFYMSRRTVMNETTFARYLRQLQCEYPVIKRSNEPFLPADCEEQMRALVALLEHYKFARAKLPALFAFQESIIFKRKESDFKRIFDDLSGPNVGMTRTQLSAVADAEDGFLLMRLAALPAGQPLQNAELIMMELKVQSRGMAQALAKAPGLLEPDTDALRENIHALKAMFRNPEDLKAGFLRNPDVLEVPPSLRVRSFNFLAQEIWEGDKDAAELTLSRHLKLVSNNTEYLRDIYEGLKIALGEDFARKFARRLPDKLSLDSQKLQRAASTLKELGFDPVETVARVSNITSTPAETIRDAHAWAVKTFDQTFVEANPFLLTMKTSMNLQPTYEVLVQLGISQTDIRSNAKILATSLENRLAPLLRLFKHHSLAFNSQATRRVVMRLSTPALNKMVQHLERAEMRAAQLENERKEAEGGGAETEAAAEESSAPKTAEELYRQHNPVSRRKLDPPEDDPELDAKLEKLLANDKRWLATVANGFDSRSGSEYSMPQL